MNDFDKKYKNSCKTVYKYLYGNVAEFGSWYHNVIKYNRLYKKKFRGNGYELWRMGNAWKNITK